jgi:hypothetical protein
MQQHFTPKPFAVCFKHFDGKTKSNANQQILINNISGRTSQNMCGVSQRKHSLSVGIALTNEHLIRPSGQIYISAPLDAVYLFGSPICGCGKLLAALKEFNQWGEIIINGGRLSVSTNTPSSYDYA